MDVFDIKVRGIDFSPKIYSIIAKDAKEALEIAQRFNKAAQDYGEWCELVDVTYNVTITKPEDFEKEMADMKAKDAARAEAEREEENQ